MVDENTTVMMSTKMFGVAVGELEKLMPIGRGFIDAPFLSDSSIFSTEQKAITLKGRPV